jgi:hypothetical protein
LRIMPRSCDAAVVAARHTMVTAAFVSFTEARGHATVPPLHQGVGVLNRIAHGGVQQPRERIR